MELLRSVNFLNALNPFNYNRFCDWGFQAGSSLSPPNLVHYRHTFRNMAEWLCGNLIG